MNKHIEYLKELYGSDSEWIDRHKIVIDQYRLHNMAICGSLGRNIYGEKPIIPNDIDLVTDSLESAMAYVSVLQKYAMSKQFSYGKLLFQNNTEFCLSGVSHHLRLETSFWMPICIFVLKDPLKFWFKWDLKLQYMEDNKKYKKELDEKRKKDEAKEAIELTEVAGVVEESEDIIESNSEIPPPKIPEENWSEFTAEFNQMLGELDELEEEPLYSVNEIRNIIKVNKSKDSHYFKIKK